MLHKNTRGEGSTLSSTIPSRIERGGGDKRAERSLHSAARRAIIRRGGENRAAPVPSTPLRAGGMTEGKKGKRNLRTGPAERDRPLHKKERGGRDGGEEERPWESGGF